MKIILASISLLLAVESNSAIVITLTTNGTTCSRNNGRIIVNASGGIAPYTYSINAGAPQTSNVFLYLSATTHTVTVTDAAMETATTTVTLVNQFTPPNPPTVLSATRPSDCMAQDGSLTLTSTGGTPPYLYSLDRVNFQPSNTWTNMYAGTFWSAVRDANGCTSPWVLITARIPESQNCVIKEAGSTQSYICNPYRSHLELHVTEGTAPYEYSLDGINFQSNPDFYPQPAGIHTITVRDAAGNIKRYQVALIDQCFSPFAVTGNVVAARCATANGSITVTASDGYGPFTYSIDGINFGNSNSFNGLLPGQYTVTVKDVHDQVATKFFIVGDAGCLTVSSTVLSSTCGNANGSIEVAGTGGVAPYQYAIGSGGFSANNKFTNLPAAVHIIRVKDVNGSTASVPVTLNDIAGPAVSSVNTSPASCTGNDGSLAIIAQGGTAPFQYSINGSTYQSSNNFTGLAATNYTVYLKDANGCIAQRVAAVTDINTITADAGPPVTICEGDKITLNAKSSAIKFDWSPAAGLSSTTVLNPVAAPLVTTEYILTATTGTCVAISKVIVSVNKAPLATASKDTTICLGKSVELFGGGGNSFSWSPATYLDNRNSMNPVVITPPVGIYSYSLSVRDNNNCPSLVPATVRVKVEALKMDAGHDTMIHAGQPLQLQATAGFLRYEWSPATGLDDFTKANPVAILNTDQLYTVMATAAGGCTATDKIAVKVFRDIDIYVPTAFTPDNNGQNDILKAIPVGIKLFRHFSIYNRAGTLIFRTTDANSGWDGNYKGAEQYGMHVWSTEGIDYKGNLIRRKGTVMVIR